MCEIKVKLEDVQSTSPSFLEDIVDGFAFASFVCEDDLKVRRLDTFTALVIYVQ